MIERDLKSNLREKVLKEFLQDCLEALQVFKK